MSAPIVHVNAPDIAVVLDGERPQDGDRAIREVRAIYAASGALPALPLWGRVAERIPSGSRRTRNGVPVVLPRLADERGPLARDFAPGHFEATARGIIRAGVLVR